MQFQSFSYVISKCRLCNFKVLYLAYYKCIGMAIIKRQLTTAFESLLPKYPILALTGPRQSGKTTLLRAILPTYRYVSLENPDTRSYATDDPVGFLKEYDAQVIFDEVQRAPALFSYLQTLVDSRGQMGQFILSGSQNFHLLERITQSLAGRVAIFKLLPLLNTK